MSLELPPERWAAVHGINILDPDGWRVDSKLFTEPVTEQEFYKRVNACTADFSSVAARAFLKRMVNE